MYGIMVGNRKHEVMTIMQMTGDLTFWLIVSTFAS